MLTLLQLSDIHFSRPSGSTFDVDYELRQGVLQFVPKLRQRLGAVDAIIVTGDVAYSGLPEQYATAAGFLRDLRSGLGDPHLPVYVIPGNHDIHQPTTDSADQRTWRSFPRQSGLASEQRDQRLEQLLSDEIQGPGLLEPLTSYNDFATKFSCAISVERPFWEAELPLGDQWKLRLVGMTSVLLSNVHDKIDRLVLGSFQAARIAPSPGTAILTLCHHPYTWLLDGEDQATRIQNLAELHITGHEHAHALNKEDHHIHLCAGALQPPTRVDSTPRFNAIKLAIEAAEPGPRLRVVLLAAVWNASTHAFEVDEVNSDTHFVSIPALVPSGDIDQIEQDVRHLTERLASLQDADRLDVAAAIGVKFGDLSGLDAASVVAAAIDHARLTEQLAKLWEDVEKYHGRPLGDDNPFNA